MDLRIDAQTMKRTESPDVHTAMAGRFLIIAPSSFNGKESSFQQILNNSAGAAGFPHQKNGVGPCLLSDTKISLKWISDLHLRAKTIKFLGENRGKFP